VAEAQVSTEAQLKAERARHRGAIYSRTTLHVEYAERRTKPDILFIFRLFSEYIHLEYVRIHVIFLNIFTLNTYVFMSYTG